MTTQHFPGLPEGVGQARRWLRAELTTHDLDPETIDEATLIVSELSTNALLHTRSGNVGGHFTVNLDVQHSRLRISVTDQGTDEQTHPQWDQHPDPYTDHGRGLQLITNLTQNWTTTTNKNHHTIHTNLPLLTPAITPRGRP